MGFILLVAGESGFQFPMFTISANVDLKKVNEYYYHSLLGRILIVILISYFFRTNKEVTVSTVPAQLLVSKI